MPLVSRRFREACRDPSLWRVLQLTHMNVLTKERWTGMLHWLTGHASRLGSIQFTDDNVRFCVGCVTAIKCCFAFADLLWHSI